MFILITRPEDQAIQTKKLFQKHNIQSLILPFSKTDFIRTNYTFDFSKYNGVIFTSRNGVTGFYNNFQEGYDLPTFCVGDSTMLKAKEAGFKNVSSADGNVEDLIELISSHFSKGDLFLYPTCNVRRPQLEKELSEKGFEIDAVEVYESKIKEDLYKDILALFETGKPYIIVFFSQRVAERFLLIIQKYDLSNFLKQCYAVSMSERIGNKIQLLPWKQNIVSKKPKVSFMIEEIQAILEKN